MKHQQRIIGLGVARAACVLAFVAGQMLFAGCASFRSNTVEPIESFPAVAEAKKSVRLTLSYRQKLNENDVNNLDGVAEENLRNDAIDRFTGSGFFAAVDTEAESPDLVVKLEYTDHGKNSSPWIWATNLSFYLIPNKVEDRVVVKAVVADGTGKELGTYEVEETITQWQQLFLGVLWFTHSSRKVADRVNAQLFDNILIRMHQDGIVK